MPHISAPPFAHYSGSRSPRLVLVGEAFGNSEAELGLPFVGESGKELWRCLGEAMPDVAPELHAAAAALHRYGLAWVRERESWLAAAGVGLTNVLALHPPGNNLEMLCGKKKDVGGDGYLYPPLTKGKYLCPEYLPELDRLSAELASLRPNLVVAFGNTACWALLRATNIGGIRGAVAAGAPEGAASGVKILPTYHPAAVLRQWSWRPILIADLMKAHREAAFSEIRRPLRKILIDPILPEVREFIAEIRFAAASGQCPLVAADTETEAGQITCISFAPRRDVAITIPFWDKTRPGWSYWQQHEEEEVWELIRSLMEDPCVNLCWQNGMYDFQYCLPMKLKIHRSTEDTMLLHHSLFPELQKSLGFLGSLYSNETSWKLMRRWKPDSEKRDE